MIEDINHNQLKGKIERELDWQDAVNARLSKLETRIRELELCFEREQ